MRLLEISYDEPARNLALDEVLLEGVSAGTAPDTLRLWESPRYFVVIGSSQKVGAEANEFNCLRDGVPILRRCSAGGAVLQGPGCLNFALALSYERFPEAAALHESYAFILDRVAASLSALGHGTARQGISDLALAGMKCSGNAQRRKRTACLHHGTLLYHMEAGLMARYLHEPSDRPEYRGDRTHGDFVQPVAASREQLCEALRNAFCAGAAPGALLPGEEQAVALLVNDKYRSRDWNYRR